MKSLKIWVTTSLTAIVVFSSLKAAEIALPLLPHNRLRLSTPRHWSRVEQLRRRDGGTTRRKRMEGEHGRIERIVRREIDPLLVAIQTVADRVFDL